MFPVPEFAFGPHLRVVSKTIIFTSNPMSGHAGSNVTSRAARAMLELSIFEALCTN
jgi:hypothetical protein